METANKLSCLSLFLLPRHIPESDYISVLLWKRGERKRERAKDHGGDRKPRVSLPGWWGFFHREPETQMYVTISTSPLPKTGTALLTWNSKLCRHIWPSKWPLYQVSKQSLEVVRRWNTLQEREELPGSVNTANLCGPHYKWQGDIFISYLCLTVRKPRTWEVRWFPYGSGSCRSK